MLLSAPLSIAVPLFTIRRITLRKWQGLGPYCTSQSTCHKYHFSFHIWVHTLVCYQIPYFELTLHKE